MTLKTSLQKVKSLLKKKLEYLVSSRPTAVNLSDAANKLTEIVINSAATAKEANQVFQAYLEAVEIMLQDDIASNKAIGSYGSSFIHNQKYFKKLSVLTHCNTGSLATAGYGTALGAIGSLHADRVLESAYSTETRPFNQNYFRLVPSGARLAKSRLMAFELVHEKIPATLIADYVVALMKAGRVGAERVSANGLLPEANDDFGNATFFSIISQLNGICTDKVKTHKGSRQKQLQKAVFNAFYTKNGQEMEIHKMRLRFATKILTHDINIHIEEMSDEAHAFAKKHTDKQAKQNLIRDAVVKRKKAQDS
nr:methylthioribose-1-phosphate isomerase [Tanacetum cinerariifolium]